MTADDLLNILLQVPAHEPQAVALLRERRQATGLVFPAPEVSHVQIVRATTEMKTIADEAERMARKLMHLQPVALTDSGAESVIGGYCL